MSDREAKGHLCDYLFHGPCKNFRDSTRYLYDDPSAVHAKVKIAARKAEFELEDSK